MVKNQSHIPFYVQMILLLQNALALLDEQGREEVRQFILNSQNNDGGFRDRGGASDLYYSFFGLLILKAMEEPGNLPVEHSLKQLQQFTARQSSVKVPGFIEKCCLVLLQKELKSKSYFRFTTLFSLSRSFWKERASINLSYRSFVLFLTMDAVLPVSSLLKGPAKRLMDQTAINEHSPCSEVAAKVFLNKMMQRENIKEVELLQSFIAPCGGFKAFLPLGHADMLSTAVALFALRYAGADLRLLKPSTLDFIQINYHQGAFLSGDGDTTTDVEYTFYGLLALGILSS